MTSPRRELLAGVRAELPILFGVVPFGLIYGVVAVSAGLPPALASVIDTAKLRGKSVFDTLVALMGHPVLPYLSDPVGCEG